MSVELDSRRAAAVKAIQEAARAMGGTLSIDEANTILDCTLAPRLEATFPNRARGRIASMQASGNRKSPTVVYALGVAVARLVEHDRDWWKTTTGACTACNGAPRQTPSVPAGEPIDGTFVHEDDCPAMVIEHELRKLADLTTAKDD